MGSRANVQGLEICALRRSPVKRAAPVVVKRSIKNKTQGQALRLNLLPQVLCDVEVYEICVVEDY